MTKSIYSLLFDRKATNERKIALSVFIFWQCLFLLYPIIAGAQTTPSGTYKLTLTEAIQFAKTQNKWVQTANIEVTAVNGDRNDSYNAALPSINAGSSYQRFSDLILFTDGLGNSTTGPRKPTPNAATLGVDVSFNIYSGGKQRALQREQTSRVKLSKLNALDVSGNIGFQAASQYLDLVRLNELHKFILDQLKRAKTRLNNINSLYKNQKVTKSDVLRAEVALSNVELSLEQNQNDIAIANQKLDI